MDKNYLKVNDLIGFHQGNHNNFENPHDQYKNKMGIHLTTSTDNNYEVYTKFAKINIEKEQSNSGFFYKIIFNTLFPKQINNLCLYIQICLISGSAVIKTYVDGLTSDNSRIKYYNFVYSVVEDTDERIEVDFYINPNIQYTILAFDLEYAQNSREWYLKDHTAYNSILLLDEQPLVELSNIPNYIIIERKVAYYPPKYNEHRKSEIVYNIGQEKGSYTGWVCVESGTPGKWVGFGQIGTLKGASSERPSTGHLYPGYLYFDTSLSSNGKPIWWNGSVWVDANGNVV